MPPRDVPAFETDAFRPRASRYCWTVFVLNERHRLERQLERMAPYAGDLDIVIADGGSTDGGTDPELLRSLGVATLLVKTGPGRLSAQMRMAIAYAMDAGYEGIVTIDGNNKDDPSAVTHFLSALDDGFDHVQGSRFIPGGRAIRTPWSRWLAIRAIHAPAVRLAAGFPYTDTTNGFRAYSRRLLTDPRVQPLRAVFEAYELHYYLAIRAARLGFRVTEVPVTRAYPPHGPMPTKISPVRGNLRVLRTLVSACLHRYDPAEKAEERVDQ